MWRQHFHIMNSGAISVWVSLIMLSNCPQKTKDSIWWTNVVEKWFERAYKQDVWHDKSAENDPQYCFLLFAQSYSTQPLQENVVNWYCVPLTYINLALGFRTTEKVSSLKKCWQIHQWKVLFCWFAVSFLTQKTVFERVKFVPGVKSGPKVVSYVSVERVGSESCNQLGLIKFLHCCELQAERHPERPFEPHVNISVTHPTCF